MAASAKQLLEQRAKIVKQARDINDTHRDPATGALPAEHQEQFDKAMVDAAALKKAADDVLAIETDEAELNEPQRHGFNHPNPGSKPGSGDGDRRTVKIRTYERDAHGRPVYSDVAVGKRGSSEYEAAFAKALKNGAGSLSAEQFSALQSDSSEDGGYLNASEQFASGLLQDVDNLLFIRQHATVHTVTEADSLGIRKRTARASTWAWSSELGAPTIDTALKFGKKSLTPHYLTGEIKVSKDLLRRSTMGVEGIVRGELSRDAAEKMETAYLLGNGAQQPLGVFVPSSDGISTARDIKTGSTTTFTADQIIAAKYMLKQQYRTGGERSGCRWLFHRDGIAKLAQLKDADNHYLLHPGLGLHGDEFDSLVGYPVDESEMVPNTFTDGLYVGLLAQWRYYEIADALDMDMQVLDQLYARENQVGFLGRLKTDGLPTLEEAFVRLKTGTL